MMKIVYDDNHCERLDIYLSKLFNDISRSQIKKHIDNGEILVNQKSTKAGYALQTMDEITIINLKQPKMNLKPQNIPLDIVYENEDYAIINKPQGMVVHPAAGNYDGTLVNALLYKIKNLSDINGDYRPGIVHRLDKDTSGLIVIAKNDKSHRILAKQIETKECKRYYLALVEGEVHEDGVVNKNLVRSSSDRKKFTVCENNVGKTATTIYKVKENFKNYTLLECELKTGRTHQIRVHCQYLHHPIVGDVVYGYKKQKFNTNGQLLHAYRLQLKDSTTQKIKSFECPLPKYFSQILENLRKSNQV